MPLTTETFAALTLENTDGNWEIYRGKLREKPSMSFGHNEAQSGLAAQLFNQLSSSEYRIRQNASHLTIPGGDSYIPDVVVVPTALTTQFRTDPRRFEAYSEPMPFVVEIWSPSTGNYDVDAKIPGYQKRGDAEIWRVHPFDRTVTIWRRQPEGQYIESTEQSGVVAPHELPVIRIDLDELFRSE